MSLLKLLNVGRSLSAARSVRGRYRFEKDSLFRSLSRTAIISPVQDGPSFPISAASSSSDHPPRLPEGSNSKAATPFQAFNPEILQALPKRGTLPSPPMKAGLRERLGIPRGGLKLPFPLKCAVKFHRPLLKIRVSLEGVTPVRNDLKDSDIEVLVPSRATAPAKLAKLPVRLPKLDTRELWHRLVTRALEMNAHGI